MKNFTDNSGRVFTVVVNCNTLRMVQASTGFNLGDLRRFDELLDRLRADDLFVGEVACALFADQLAAQNVKPADFLGAMSGDKIGEAADAIRDGIADFFRSGPTRQAARKLMDQSRAGQEAAIQKILNPPTSGTPSTDLPALSA